MPIIMFLGKLLIAATVLALIWKGGEFLWEILFPEKVIVPQDMRDAFADEAGEIGDKE